MNSEGKMEKIDSKGYDLGWPRIKLITPHNAIVRLDPGDVKRVTEEGME